MGRNRGQTTLGSLRAIYTEGGGGASGILSFWAGTGPKVRHIHHMINNTYKFLQLQTTSPEHQHLCWTPAKCLSTAVQMFESATKGAILMYSKEAILKVLHTTDISPGKQQRSFRFSRSVTLVFGALGSMEMMSKASIPR